MNVIEDRQVREYLKRVEASKGSTKHSHYKKDVSHLKMIDVYRIAELYNVTDHCEFHALKKILCAGDRGVKTHEQDIMEAIDSLNRRLQMIAEDCNK